MAKKLTYVHGKQQVAVSQTTIKKIIWSKEFGFGVEDGGKNIPYRESYEKWPANKQWNYERGRIFGFRMGNVPIKDGKKVLKSAIYSYAALCNSGDLCG